MTQLIETGMVKEAADLYELSLENLLQLDKIAEKSAHNLLRAIEASKKRTFSKFIYALGIRHVGEHIAEVLATHFGSLKGLEEATEDELTAIDEIGPQISESIVSFFSDPSNRKNIQRLRDAGIRFETRGASEPSPVAGKTFVITGALDSLKRGEAKELIIRKGGRLASSVGHSTDYLVKGESPGSKLRKAHDLGIPILQEDEFLSLLGES